MKLLIKYFCVPLIALSFLTISCEKTKEDDSPGFHITSPSNGEIIPQRTTKIISLDATKRDEVLAYTIEIYVDDSLLFGTQPQTIPFEYSWNTSELTLGSHTIKATSRFSGQNYNYPEVKVTIGPWDGEIGTVNDIDGNTYKTVKIGDQWWMAENLATTKLNDATQIANKTELSDWSSTSVDPAYVWYGNNEVANRKIFGALYNWYTVTTGKVCPSGWHVPIDEEWQELVVHLGVSQDDAATNGGMGTNEGSKLAYYSALWDTTIQGKSNISSNAWFGTSGFDAVPGGYRNKVGTFLERDVYAHFWTATANDEFFAYSHYLKGSSTNIVKNIFSHKSHGYSVRCIRDD